MKSYADIIRNMFLLAVSDGPESASSMEGLLHHHDPDISNFGAAAKDLREGILKSDASMLGDALKKMNALPQTSAWSSVIDEAARFVLEKAVSMGNESPFRLAMIECGIAMAAYSTSYGFAASDSTLELVRKTRDGSKTARWLADEAHRRSQAQKPQKDGGGSAFKAKSNGNSAAKRGLRIVK